MPDSFSIAEILALLSGAGYALLVVRRNRWAWGFGAISSCLLAVLAARNGLPLQAVLQGVYVLMAGYGFWHWSRSAVHTATTQQVRIARWPWGWHVLALVLIVGCTTVMAPWLAAHTDAAWPRLDTFVTLLSFIATVMTARAVLENWGYWLLVDALSFYLYFSQGLNFVAALYVVYFVIAVWGLSSWLAQHRRDCILPSGGHNRLQRVVHFFDERVRRDWVDEQTAQWLGTDPVVEVAAQRLAAAHGLAPAVLRVDPARRRLWMPYLPGGSLPERWFEEPLLRARMWQMLDQLRGIEAPDLPSIDLPARALELHQRLILLDSAGADRWTNRLEQALVQWRAIVAQPTQRECLVHGDLSPSNLHVTETGSWQLLDWEYAHRGHPLEDLAGLIAASELPIERWRREYPPPVLQSEAQWREFDARLALRRVINGLWSDVACAAGRRLGVWHPQGQTGKLA
jgi:nicotinamide mononucleotide transporter